MAEDAPPLTEKYQREAVLESYAKDSYDIIERIDKRIKEIGERQKKMEGELRRRKPRSGEPTGPPVWQTTEGHEQLRAFFTGVSVQSETSQVAPRDASQPKGSLTLIVAAVMTGVLSGAVFLVPNESPWMLLMAGVLLLSALVSGALAIRYDRGPTTRSLRRRQGVVQNRFVVRCDAGPPNEVA